MNNNLAVENRTTYSKNKTKNSVIMILLILMMIFMNHSSVVFGFNISFADFFCFLIFIIIFFKKIIILPYTPTMFFIIVSTVTLFDVFFLTQSSFSTNIELNQIIGNYLKLIISFIYFILGYFSANRYWDEKALRWFSTFAFVVGIVGMVTYLFKVPFLKDIMLFGGIRLKGFMNDPNYFSIIQLAAFTYYFRNINVKPLMRTIILGILIISILMSGSKTGLISLLIYITIMLTERIMISNKKIKIKTLIIITILLTATLFLWGFTSLFIILSEHLSNLIPSYERIKTVLTDFKGAISQDGSERLLAWGNAFKLLELYPLTGIGIGTYSGLSQNLFGTNLLVHNTYLQLAVEWGIPLSFIFFLYLFAIIKKNIVFFKEIHITNIMIRDIIIIFLIGFLGISFNNARLFWILFGMLVSKTVANRNIRRGAVSCEHAKSISHNAGL